MWCNGTRSVLFNVFILVFLFIYLFSLLPIRHDSKLELNHLNLCVLIYLSKNTGEIYLESNYVNARTLIRIYSIEHSEQCPMVTRKIIRNREIHSISNKILMRKRKAEKMCTGVYNKQTNNQLNIVFLFVYLL